jgi:hypothetical protein
VNPFAHSALVGLWGGYIVSVGVGETTHLPYLQGFVVFSLEHADGTASTVRLAGTRGYKYYSGWGTEDSRMEQTRCVHCKSHYPVYISPPSS